MANVELATAYISLIPSMKGAQGRIAQELAGVDADGIGKGLGSRMGGGMVGAMKGLVGPALAAVAAVGFGGFIKEAAAASDATDKFKATMSFAGLKTTAIDAATKAAKSFADQTVYDLPTIQNTIAQLASNGVKDYTGLTKAAGNLNAVAGGNADTFKSVAMVMTQTAGAGKLTTENWNQMADAIPGAAGPLMKSLKEAGAYTGNFRDAMADGQITSDEFNASLMKLGNDPVAVEAAKSTKTFEGAIGNLQATINSGLMGALDKMKPTITGAINLLSNGLGKAFDFVGNAATGLYDILVKGDFTGALRKAFNVEEDSPLVGVLFTIRSYAVDLIGGFRAMFAAYKAGDGDITSTGFAGVMERVGFGVREVTRGFTAMFAAYKAGDGDVTSSGFPGFMERVGNVARTVTGGISAMFAAYKAGDGDVTSSGFAGFMERVGNVLRTATGGVSAFFAAFKAGDGDVTSSGFAGFMEQLGNTARQAFDAIGPAIAALVPQILPLWSALSPIQTIFQALAPMLPQIVGILGQLAATIGSNLATAITGLLPAFQTLQGVFITVFQQVLATVLPAVVQLVGMLGATLSQLIPIVVPIVTQIATLAATLVSQLAPIITNLISAILPPLIDIFGNILSAIGPVISMIAGLLIPIIQALMPVVVTVFGVIANVIRSAMQIVQGIIQIVTGIITGNWSQVWSGIQNILSGVWNTIVAAVRGAIGIVGSVISAGLSIVRTVWTAVWNGISSFLSGVWNGIVQGVSGAIGNVVGFFGGLIGKITGAIGDAGRALWDTGVHIIQGLIDGIGSMMGAIGRAVINIVPEAIRGPFEQLLGIHSPSRVFKAYGGYIGQGLIIGMTGTVAKIRSTTQGMAKNVIAAFDHKQVSARSKNSLLDAISRTNDRLVGLANRRGGILSALKTADSKYQAQVKNRNAYAAEVSKDVMGGVDASKTIDLAGRLTSQIAKTKELTTTLSQLKKLGLDSVTYKQLADGGLDSLNAAQALLATGKSGIAKVGGLQEQLQGAANGLGNTAANNLYGAGVNAAKGLVDGLKSQQAAITAQMTAIAKSMSGTLKRALGIRSPSRVFRGHGVNVGQGLELGIRDMHGNIDAAVKGMVTVPAAPSFGVRSAGSDLRTTDRGGNTFNIHEANDGTATAVAVARRQRLLTV